MTARYTWASVALAAMLVAAGAAWADEHGYIPSKGGIGGQLGAGTVLGNGDYSAGAATRFSFSAHWRYAMTPSWRLQLSPGFTWAGYDPKEPVPFREHNFPEDSTKKDYLTLLVPVSLQLQFTHANKHGWLYYVGVGPGVYRVWVENHRKVLEDPVTHDLHRGLYPGGTFQLGVERFLKSLPSTSIEVSVDGHYVFAKRDEQFPSGWNDELLDMGIRIGGNYYFATNVKKKEPGLPGIPNP